MNLSCSNKVIKYLMFTFNLIFVLSGIIILSVGVTVKAYYYDYDTFLDEKYFSLPNMLIATGTIIFLISFFGCYGAIKENWILLMIFSILLMTVFIFEFSAGIAGYVLRDKTSSYLENQLQESLHKYSNNTEFQKMWDVIQRKFECCGVSGPEDWSSSFPDGKLPVSCCNNVFGTVGTFTCNSQSSTSATAPTSTSNLTTQSSTVPSADQSTTTPSNHSSIANDTVSANLMPKRARRQAASDNNQTTAAYPNPPTKPYTVGCEQAFGDFVKTHAVQIGGWAMALAVIQLIGILFSCHLSRQLKNGYYST